jgi:hypothetical protein
MTHMAFEDTDMKSQAYVLCLEKLASMTCGGIIFWNAGGGGVKPENLLTHLRLSSKLLNTFAFRIEE